MTTAHRPTWKAAVGRADEGGYAFGTAVHSKLDAPAHTKLKFRQGHQKVDRDAALKESLIALQQAETKASAKSERKRHQQLFLKNRQAGADKVTEKRSQQRLLKQTAEVDDVQLKAKYDDDDVDDGGGSDNGDDGGGEDDDSDLDSLDSDDDSSSSDDGDDSDDEDDEAALQAELAKIREERAEAKRKVDEKVAAEEASREQEAALLGNPLLVASGDSSGSSMTSGRMKRRWNDDVVFRHQAAGEPKPKKRFINDTVRNDFHKRFLNKFIR